MTYQGIIERVRAATGADEDLDRAIEDFLGIGRHPFVHRGWLDNSFTASIDAALALAEKVLPDANCYGVEREPQGWTAYMSRNNVKTGHWMKEAQAPTAPLAIVLATLLALQSQEPK